MIDGHQENPGILAQNSGVTPVGVGQFSPEHGYGGTVEVAGGMDVDGGCVDVVQLEPFSGAPDTSEAASKRINEVFMMFLLKKLQWVSQHLYVLLNFSV